MFSRKKPRLSGDFVFPIIMLRNTGLLNYVFEEKDRNFDMISALL